MIKSIEKSDLEEVIVDDLHEAVAEADDLHALGDLLDQL